MTQWRPGGGHTGRIGKKLSSQYGLDVAWSGHDALGVWYNKPPPSPELWNQQGVAFWDLEGVLILTYQQYDELKRQRIFHEDLLITRGKKRLTVKTNHRHGGISQLSGYRREFQLERERERDWSQVEWVSEEHRRFVAAREERARAREKVNRKTRRYKSRKPSQKSRDATVMMPPEQSRVCGFCGNTEEEYHQLFVGHIDGEHRCCNECMVTQLQSMGYTVIEDERPPLDEVLPSDVLNAIDAVVGDEPEPALMKAESPPRSPLGPEVEAFMNRARHIPRPSTQMLLPGFQYGPHIDSMPVEHNPAANPATQVAMPRADDD